MGKTRYVMDGFGYSNVFVVDNYKQSHALYDGYAFELAVCYDEYNSSIRIQDMNRYLDGYPISLPARYTNKQACYEKVFIISNLDLLEQYTHEQQTQPEVWAAFLRRIHKVIRFMPDGTRREYDTKDYIIAHKGYNNHNSAFIELPANTSTPFDDMGASVQNPLEVEQM